MSNNKDIKKLLAQMTIDEKVGQCVQLSAEYFGLNGEITGPLEGYQLTQEQIYNVGSVLGYTGSEKTRQLQEKYLVRSRLKIPLMFMADVVHGFETSFPIPLALACSFEPSLAKRTSEVTACETYASGCHVTFAPMVDIVRDARWGRVMEANGEDQFLVCEFAKNYVEGFQGKSLLDKNTIVSCVKHFAGYGAAEAGREYNTVDMSERIFREFFLPPYESAIKAGCKMVMTSFNTIDSVPASTNKWLLDDLLRKELKFDATVISDWSSIKETIAHGTSQNLADAGSKALLAGCDIEMSSPCYFEALNQEKLNLEALDIATLRVLNLKKQLGLFENPFRGCDMDYEKSVLLCEKHKNLALESAQKSIVLLKNEQAILPLKKNTKVAIVGPNAKELDINGSWSCNAKPDNNILLSKALKEDVEICFVGEVFMENHVRHVDLVLYLGGEKNYMSGEACSRSDIGLCFNQLEDLKRLENFEKDVVFINYSGRPNDLSQVKAKAIVQAWFLGTMTNQAIASVLVGKFNPSGKLVMSFPRNVGQCPIYYNQFNTGRPYVQGVDGYTSTYLDVHNTPLYPFGYGLTYSNIILKNIKLNSTKFSLDQEIIVTGELENKSAFKATEVVQMYMYDVCADVVRPIKQLKGYKKVTILPNTKTEFEIKCKLKEFMYIDLNCQKKLDDGLIKIYVGLNSQDTECFEIKMHGCKNEL